jgi:uncharacterized protein YyaL (SSP411 family)
MMWNGETGTLARRFRAGARGIDGYAEDYACLVFGLLELFQTDGEPGWLEAALRLQARQDALFWDEADGGWFSTTGADPSVLLRMKEDHDGAEPSPNSVSALNHITLFHLTGAQASAAKAERALERLGPRLGQFARAVPLMARALATWHAGLSQIVIVGPPDREDTRQMRDVLARRHLPFAIVIPVHPGAQQERLARLLPWLGSMSMRDGRATAYVCRDFTCLQPVTTAGELEAIVGNER